MPMIDPLAPMREIAVARVNGYYNRKAQDLLHKEKAYPEKRAAAETLLSGGTATDELIAEAALTGITVEELAQTIVSKPVVSTAQRELERQQVMHKIATIGTPKELEDMLLSMNLGGFSNVNG